MPVYNDDKITSVNSQYELRKGSQEIREDIRLLWDKATEERKDIIAELKIMHKRSEEKDVFNNIRSLNGNIAHINFRIFNPKSCLENKENLHEPLTSQDLASNYLKDKIKKRMCEIKEALNSLVENSEGDINLYKKRLDVLKRNYSNIKSIKDVENFFNDETINELILKLNESNCEKKDLGIYPITFKELLHY